MNSPCGKKQSEVVRMVLREAEKEKKVFDIKFEVLENALATLWSVISVVRLCNVGNWGILTQDLALF